MERSSAREVKLLKQAGGGPLHAGGVNATTGMRRKPRVGRAGGYRTIPKSIQSGAQGHAIAESVTAGALGEARAGKPEPDAVGNGCDCRLPEALAARIAALPEPVAQAARLGAARVADYQDDLYAGLYVDRVERIARAEPDAGAPGNRHEVACETARGLAEWMCYEDVIRTASLKLEEARIARAHGGADARDFAFRPTMTEIAAVLPRRFGAWLERRALIPRGRPRAGRSVTVGATSMARMMVLRLVAALRPLRPRSLRFWREQGEIGRWLAAIEHALITQGRVAAAHPLELAGLPRLFKWYDAGCADGRTRYRQVMDAYLEHGGPCNPRAAQVVHAATPLR
jgi:hypothetical protein